MASSKNDLTLEHEKVEAFLKDTFRQYLLNYDGFFFDENEYGQFVPLPLYENGKIREDILSRSSKFLGISQEDILNCNYDASRQWFRKFPFFELLNQFYVCRRLSLEKENKKAEQYMQSVCAGHMLDKPKNYDMDDIRERIIAMLKKVNAFLPETYHEGAEIKDIQIQTNNFFSFPKIGALIGSFLDIFSRIRELFFNAWKKPLNESEIMEYNFLVTTMQLADIITGRYIYYNDLQKLIPVFQSEGYKGENEEFLNIVKLKFCRTFEPWECKEFCENVTLAQCYEYCYPYAKRKMFEFGMSVKYLVCTFNWSDVTKPEIDIEEEFDKLDPYDTSDVDKLIQELENYQETGIINTDYATTVRLPKTSDELNGEECYIEKLIRLGGVVSKGGLQAPTLWKEQKGLFEARWKALRWGTTL